MHKILVIALTLGWLAACGRDDKHDSRSQPSPAPDFTRDWSHISDSVDSTVNVGSALTFRSRFKAEYNCGLAVFKFVTIRDGLMYVQTKTDVVIRQGQPHDLLFDEAATVYRAAEGQVDDYYHIYKCLGQEGFL